MAEIHVHVHRTRDVSEKYELAYQGMARARKQAQLLVDKLTSAMDRAKTEQGVMSVDQAREVEAMIRSAAQKVV